MNNNPFEYLQSFMNQNNMGKYMKGFDMSSMSNMTKNSAEAISVTNQMAADNIQSIFKKGSDNFEKNTTELYNTIKESMSSGDVNQMSKCQQRYLETAVDNNFNSTKEIVDISTKSMLDMINFMQKSIKENTSQSFTAAENK
jgi:hypothetical protein